MGERAIESNTAAVSIQVRLNRLEGRRLETREDTSAVKFDVDVKMDEESRTGGELVISFLLSISTKPSIVKFEAGGTAVITGGQKAFEEALEVDPISNVPKVLHTIYQHVFTSLFLLSTMLNTPYPPPDLLHPSARSQETGGIQGVVGPRPEDQVAAQTVQA